MSSYAQSIFIYGIMFNCQRLIKNYPERNFRNDCTEFIYYISVKVNISIYCYSADIRIYLLLDNKLDRRIDVTAMQFLLVQHRHQTNGWTPIGSGACRLWILEWLTFRLFSYIHVFLLLNRSQYCNRFYLVESNPFWVTLYIASS